MLFDSILTILYSSHFIFFDTFWLFPLLISVIDTIHPVADVEGEGGCVDEHGGGLDGDLEEAQMLKIILMTKCNILFMNFKSILRECLDFVACRPTSFGDRTPQET